MSTALSESDKALREISQSLFPTVVFFPKFHPDVGLVIRRFSLAYHSPFIVRLLDYNQMPDMVFYTGWNVVVVGKIYDRKDVLSDVMWTQPLHIYFKDWLNPTFKKIHDPRKSFVPSTIPAKPMVIPDLDIQVEDVVVPVKVAEVVKEQPKAKSKKPVLVTETKKKEAVSVALRTSERLGKIDDKIIRAAILECQQSFSTPRVKQSNLIRCLLRTVFNQNHYRDADVEYMNNYLPARMLSVKGVVYHKSACSYSLKS